ncbi:MAG TPA: superoxide dismutase [Caulobacteraceae bacterium]|nr:superoxide dismutase [Caulobacteraceae bacterium]
MFVLPDLPFRYDALAPTISERTLRFHHDRHHKAYVETTNQLIAQRDTSAQSLEAVIREARTAGAKKLFNNAAQAWNHAFFWASMAPGAGRPEAELAAAVGGAFGDLAGLKAKFVEEGAGHFGSGWVWLIADGAGKLIVRSTHDADDTVAQEGQLTPLLVCDLWEHAYYLDHQNDRKGFLEAWFDNVANWRFAARQFAASRGQGEPWRYPAPVAQAPQRRSAAG